MKYTHEERLEIGRRIYTGEISKYQAAAEYEINYGHVINLHTLAF